MRRYRQALLCCALALLAAACSSPPPPRPSVMLSPQYLPARDGSFRYRVPVGWFDVTADSQRNGTLVWLIRSDYAAALTVSEVHLDARAREEVRERGLGALAQTMMDLARKSGAEVLDRLPQPGQIGDAACAVFRARPSPRDLARTVVLDTGGRTYAVVVLQPLRDTTAAPDMALVQQEFIAAMRW